MSPVLVVLKKELIDASRDRRSIGTVLLTAVFGPLLAGVMLTHQATVAVSDQHLRVSVIGADLAPGLVEWLQQQQGVAVVPAASDPERAIRAGTATVVLILKDDFSGRFRQSRPAGVQLLVDDARPLSVTAGARMATLLESFAGTVATARMVSRGISPEIARPFDVERRDVATSGERTALVLNFVLLLVSLALLTAGMQVASDSTAGERERRSLESLLLNPVGRWQLVLGKYLAAMIWATAALAFTLSVVSVVLARVPLDVLGIVLRTDARNGLLLLTAMWPLAVLAPAVQVYLGCFARSFTEAQGYSTFLILPVAAIGVLSILGSAVTAAWMRTVPIAAQYVMTADVLAGQMPSPGAFALAYGEAGALAAAFLTLATKFFGSDRIVMDGTRA